MELMTEDLRPRTDRAGGEARTVSLRPPLAVQAEALALSLLYRTEHERSLRGDHRRDMPALRAVVEEVHRLVAEDLSRAWDDFRGLLDQLEADGLGLYARSLAKSTAERIELDEQLAAAAGVAP